ncbi:MAG: GNAT family N-acetyltransferase [Actinobacteria bacterium]|nr:GNAT family N-acetyltransferase [Actinomycetota bacterium]
MKTAKRIALGFVEAERQRRANVPGAEVVDLDGLALAFANVPDREVNSVLVISEPTDPPEALAAAELEFRRRGRTFGVDLEVGRHPSVDEAVRSAGLTLLLSRPGMAVRVEDLPPSLLPDGVRVEPVHDGGGAAGVARVDVEAFGDGSELAERFYAQGSYGVEGARSFVAWKGDEPVGIAAAHLWDGAVGIFGVGVIPRARRRGIGAALTVMAARTFPSADLAWLHPSEMSRRMYEHLGFRPVSEWQVWVRSGD